MGFNLPVRLGYDGRRSVRLWIILITWFFLIFITAAQYRTMCSALVQRGLQRERNILSFPN